MDIDWAPSACTLPTAEQPLRRAEFDQLFAEHLRGVDRVDPHMLDLLLAADSRAEAVDLTAARANAARSSPSPSSGRRTTAFASGSTCHPPTSPYSMDWRNGSQDETR
jgi:hypothetical protein